MLERILSRQNLFNALERVERNKGSHGVDQMSVQNLRPYLKEHWLTLREELKKGTYFPQPVRRVEIPKPNGGVRKLGIPTVIDRFLQQAIAQVLNEVYDRTFSDDCNIFARSKRAGERIMQNITTLIEKKLKLKVNREKSAVDQPWKRKFLGFTFSNHREQPKIRISKQSIQRLKQRIREFTSRKWSISMEERLEKLNRYLVGWLGYYQLAETPSIF